MEEPQRDKIDLQRILLDKIAQIDEQYIAEEIERAQVFDQEKLSNSNTMNQRTADESDELSFDQDYMPLQSRLTGDPTMQRGYRVDYNYHIHRIRKFLRKHPDLPPSSVRSLTARKNTTMYRLKLERKAQWRQLCALIDVLATDNSYTQLYSKIGEGIESKSKC